MLRGCRARFCTARAAAVAAKNPNEGLYEILPRYPNFTVMGALRGLDYLGTCSFAVSGSITAATCGCDAVGCVFIGASTALGGGTIRDMLFGQLPVGWVQEPEYAYLAAGCAFFVFLCCCCIQPESYSAYKQIMFWSDTIGLGAFAVLGTIYAIRLNYDPILILICTMMTCTGGGLVRDTLCRRPPRVLHAYAETYALTTVLGGATYLGLRRLRVPLHLRVPMGVFAVVAARLFAVKTNFALPTAVAVHRAHADQAVALPTSAVGGADATAPTAQAASADAPGLSATEALSTVGNHSVEQLPTNADAAAEIQHAAERTDDAALA